MAVEIADVLLVPWSEFEVLRTPDELREYLGRSGIDDEHTIERHLSELGFGPFVVIQRDPPRYRGGAGFRPVLPSLRELPAPLPPPRQPSPPAVVLPEPEPEPAEHRWLELTLVTDDGVPIANAALDIRDDWDFETQIQTDADGHVRVDTDVAWPHHVSAAAALALPPPPLEPIPTEGLALARTPADPVRLSTGSHHVLVVARPRAEIVAIDGWVEARSVLVFGSMRDTPEGPATVRAALRTALCRAGSGTLHVVGHSDTEGKAADNEALALARATSVQLYLEGSRFAWADHAFAHADVATLQTALKWGATATGIACDPGDIDGDWGPQTAAALDALRRHADIDAAQPLGAADWAAIYDLYDLDLQTLMLTDAAGLAAARAALVLAPAQTMGERWPVVAPELDDHQCPANRRVDLVLCAAGSDPTPDTAELYDETFLCTHLAVPPEARVRLRAVTTDLGACGRARMQLMVGPITVELTTDDSGSLELTALRGESIAVLGCTDSAGASRFAWGMVPQAAAQEAS